MWLFSALLLPMRLKRRVAHALFGWTLHPTAYIGRSVILVRNVTMEAGATIGNFNVIKDFDELRMAEGAAINIRNWITGIPIPEAFPNSPDRRPALIMGRYSFIAVAANIDCADRVEFDDYSGIAGFGCSILTHSLDLVRDRYVTGPVTLGHHAFVMSGSTLLSGTTVPARSIVSAGSVVNTKLTKELTFYGGNPAEPLRELSESLRPFQRGLNGRHGPFGGAGLRH